MTDSYTYPPIDLATNSIRVLRLCKGYETEPIVCELIEIFLEADGVPYEALSYTWGDSNVDVIITLNGRRKMIKDNLYTALHCLRKANEDRWLWVDALCINQDDAQEKTHQVGRMRRVYEKADKVRIWLGRTTDDIDLLMELMKTLGKRARRRSEYRKDEPTAWLREWPILLQETGGRETDFNIRRRNALIEMLGRPWFQRVWILQEAFSAKRATINCGWNEVPTETFVLFPKLMGVETQHHVQAVLDIMPGYLRRSSWCNAEPDLRTLLGMFRQSKAKDPRDNIYALLGISSDIISNGKLQPNYNITLEQAIKDAVSYLAFGETGVCDLPLWFPESFFKYLDEFPWRILEWAINQGKEDTAREILKRKLIDINNPHPLAEAPLLTFAWNPGLLRRPASRNILQLILDEDNVNVNIENENKNAPINIATDKGNLAMVETLLKRPDADLNHHNSSRQTPLASAIVHGKNAIIRKLLRHSDLEVDFPSGDQTRGLQQYTALWLATVQNQPTTVSLLLQRGANIEARESLDGETALFAAARKGYADIVELLLQHGADIEARNLVNRVTPLWIAAKHGHENTFKLLLDRGAKLDDGSRTTHGQSVLWAVAHAGYEGMVRSILQAMPTDKDVFGHFEFLERREGLDGLTALWVASMQGHFGVVSALIEAGADLHAKNFYGHTPLWAAIDHRHFEVAKLLVRNSARLGHGDWVEDPGYRGSDTPLRRQVVNDIFLEAGVGMDVINAMVVMANRRSY